MFDATLGQDVTSPEAAGSAVTELYGAHPGEQVDNSGGGSAALLRRLAPVVVPDNETDGLAQDSSEQSSVSKAGSCSYSETVTLQALTSFSPKSSDTQEM